MRVTKGETVCGMDALELRDVFRRAHQYSRHWLGHELGLTPSEIHQLVESLCAEGYVRQYPEGSELYVLTVKGSALRMASAARPITRATATRLVQDVVCRAQQVNEGDYAYKVGAVVVFGSYCDPAAERLSDVDIAVLWIQVDDFDSVSKERIRLAFASGRNFSTDLEEMAWPETEVKRHLRGRSPCISLHDYKRTFEIVVSGPNECVFGYEPSASD